MIIACGGNIEIKGNRIEIMADVSSIVHTLVIEGKMLSEDEIFKCVELGLLSEDEAREKAERAIESINKSINKDFERLGEILGNIIRRGME